MTTPRLLSASSLLSDRVQQPSGEHLGDLKELMIDLDTGRISYAVLSFGGLFGLGDKLFALPWSVFRVDTDERVLVLDVPKETLEQAPGFDKSEWPAGAEHWRLVDTHWADHSRVA